ncbi:uncharacterized protein [Periplaneta americana]|uniref:uncharacterized protein isoform X2 n=1 Tax=Periplaneta americana TaxID=6978 RepID=UPI0037E85084
MVIMDVIKTEPEIDPLAPENDSTGNGEEEMLQSMNGNSFVTNVQEMKKDPSDLNCNLISGIKSEENEIHNSYAVLKSEVKEESWNLEVVKEEAIPPDEQQMGEDLNYRPIQPTLVKEDVGVLQIHSRDKNVQQYGVDMNMQESDLTGIRVGEWSDFRELSILASIQ